MIYVAAYLYVAGMPVAVHLLDETQTASVKPRHRVLIALLWPILLPIYLYAILSVFVLA